MRCKNCNYLIYDYSEDCEDCIFGFDDEDSKGEIGCKYTRRQLDKLAKEMEEKETEQYARMGEYFSKLKECEQ